MYTYIMLYSYYEEITARFSHKRKGSGRGTMRAPRRVRGLSHRRRRRRRRPS